MTDKSSAAIREFAEKWCLRVIECMKDDDYIMHDPEGLLSDLTALISEGYVSKEKHDKVLQQRDELREALKNLMDGVRGLPPLTAIVGVLEKQYKQAEAAIKNTDG